MSRQIYQNLYNTAIGGDLMSHVPVASDVAYHPNHEHYHFAGFASDLLVEKTGGLRLVTTKKWAKTSFCLLATARMIGSYPAQYIAYGMAL